MDGYFLYIANRLEKIRTGSDAAKFNYFRELKTLELWRAVLAEFVGTMLFVFIGCSSVIPLSYGTFEAAQIIRIAFTFGLMIAILIQIFGHVSGGHFNPAVSIAMTITMAISPARGLLYTLAQCGGGIIGGLILKGVTPSVLHSNLGATTVSGALDGGQAFGCECIYTFILVASIMGTTDGNRPLFGSPALGIGLTVTVLHLGGINFTGASMNPARTLGAAVVSNVYEHHWVYWVGPIVGGVLAALAYKYIFNPYRGVLTMEDAAVKMMSEGDMVCIPKTYFKEESKVKDGEFTSSNL